LDSAVRPLDVWLVAVGEPLELDGPDERLMRVGLLAQELASRGHHVTWWTSAFDHRRKTFRAQHDQSVLNGVQYRLLDGCGYRRNVSFKRIRDQRQVAREFARQAACEKTPPDVLFVAYPTVELAGQAVEFAARVKRPVIVDLRDLWPDIFLPALPRALRPIARPVINRMRRHSAWVLSQATAITGITDTFVDWGVERAGRQRRATDRAFPLAYVPAPVPGHELAMARQRLEQRGLLPTGNKLHVVFAGTLGRQFDFGPVFLAAAAMRHAPVHFTIAGTGEAEPELRWLAGAHSNVTLCGWLDRSDLAALLHSGTIGLAPYRSTWDFEASIPNKVLEYLACGLPVLSSLQGETANLLHDHACGLTYPVDDQGRLTTLLQQLLDDHEHVARMATNAESVFTERFSGKDIYPTMATYLEVIAHQALGIAGS
jgi:glycosyltransferase involved in cell wall biosynthesis